MYGSLFAAPLRHPFAPEILAGLTPYGLFLHGHFTIFQAFKDGIRQLLRDHVGADLGMVVSWIVIAPFIVLAKRDLLFLSFSFWSAHAVMAFQRVVPGCVTCLLSRRQISPSIRPAEMP